MFSSLLLYQFEFQQTLILGAIVALLVAYILWKWNTTTDNFPPLISGLPIVGYLPFIENNSFSTFMKLGKSIGGVYRLKIGREKVLILNDFKNAKEAFWKKEFLGRPKNYLQATEQSVVTLSGKKWEEQRQFTVKVFQKFGYGNTKMENDIKEEAKSLLKIIKSREGRPFTVRPLLQSNFGNNISTFLYGNRLSENDLKRKNIEKVVNQISTSTRQIQLNFFLPWLTKLMPFLTPKRLIEHKKMMVQIFAKDVSDHESRLNTEYPQGYVDEYLLELKNEECGKKSAFFSRENLNGNMRMMFLAGVQTVVTTMEWCFVAMSAYPDVQIRVQEEIDKVIGRNGDPSWSDRALMPYVQAVLKEVQRWRTVVPLSIFRRSTDNTTIGGFNVAKDTTVIINLWSMHNDDKIWTNCSEFLPERFLSDDGKEVVKHEAYVPFSLGKRACPGKVFAEMELFLYFVYIMQNFSISVDNEKGIDLEGFFGVSFQPQTKDFVFTCRK